MAPAGRVALTTLGAAYAAQGFGYAATVAGLSFAADYHGFGTATITILLLVVCLGAAAGSVLADQIAARQDSRWALSVGLALEAAGLVCAASLGPDWLYVVGVVLYALGLGAVDASAAMQGVIVQRGRERPVMGRMFAAYTAAGIAGALLTSAALSTAAGFRGSLLVAIGVDLVLALIVPRLLARPVPAPSADPGALALSRAPLPRGPVWFFGGLIFAAYVVDTAVSTWSTPQLHEGLDVAAGRAPLGYAAYLAVMLVARLVVDAVTVRLGHARVTVSAALCGVVGLAVVLVASAFGPAVAGFALCGVVSGMLVPIAFTGAGASVEGDPDAMIARVNLFNYAGALVGAVLSGAAASLTTTRLAFVVPLAALVLILPVLVWSAARGPLAPRASGPEGLAAESS